MTLVTALAAGLLSPSPARADITNEAVARAGYGGGTVVSLPVVHAVPVAPGVPSLSVGKSGALVEGDGVAGASLGDVIRWQVEVTNTGTLAIGSVTLDDPRVTLALTGGDGGAPGIMEPGETWTYAGDEPVTQAMLDEAATGAPLVNTVTATGTAGPAGSTPSALVGTARAELALSPTSRLALAKTTSATRQLFPGVYEVSFTITLRNDGTVTLGDVRLADDLAAAFAPTRLVSRPTIELIDLPGASANSAFDGAADTALFATGADLGPGATGAVRLTVLVDVGLGGLEARNTALATAQALPGPVDSDDPAVTPDDPADFNPAPVVIVDTDRDGAPDGAETAEGDRDGDGVPDASDYDPTGAFYCQADGRILPGGSIRVEEVGGSAAQEGVGTDGTITIVRDGSDGRYQFHVNRAGRYRLLPTLPPGGVASTERRPGAPLDLTAFLPANPAVLGAGETGATGVLADASAEANPFSLEFDIEAGDPALFHNNIPLAACGRPALAAAKALVAEPEVQADGSSRVTWRVTARSSGNERVDQVQLRDNLAEVFGSTRFSIASVRITAAPAGFAASVNPFYDGAGDTALLTSGASLKASEAVSLEIAVVTGAPAADYVNTVRVTGIAPLDASPVPEASASAPVSLTSPGPGTMLVATKAADLRQALRGQPIGYTITLANPSAAAVTGVSIVDQLPLALAYRRGTASVDGVAEEPAIAGRELVFAPRDIAPGATVTVRLVAVLGAAADGPDVVNAAFGRAAAGGRTLSNIARATVRLVSEPVFDCSEVIGSVFEDGNRDGARQDGEPGVPAVRLATPRGLLVTTDDRGRYHITCAMMPDATIGSNFVIKLDERTLPDGYKVTSENPRSVRLTRGKMSRADFGVAGLQLVEIDIDARAFVDDSPTLLAPSLRTIDGLMDNLARQPSRLRITYRREGDAALAGRRLDLLKALVEAIWKRRGAPYDLQVETRLVAG